MTIKLKGWNAVLAIVAVLAFVLFRVVTQSKALETQGVQQVQQWLQMEHARQVLPAMQQAMNSGSTADSDLTNMAAGMAQENFEVLSMTRHGGSDKAVVRVEVRDHNHPGTQEVRYLLMQHSMVTGWRVIRETNRTRYYLALF